VSTEAPTQQPANGETSGDGLPRGIVIIVAVGLLACVLAAVLSTDKGEGSAASLEWVQKKPIADSEKAEVPGSKGATFQLTEGGIRATGTNAAEPHHELFRVLSVIHVSAGAKVGGGRIECTMTTPKDTEVGQTHNSRATYPRSSEELFEQEMPETVLIEFSSHADELAVLEVEDLPERWATEKGIKLEWPEYRPQKEGWRWFLPPNPPKEELVLPFFTVWNTTGIPKASISCSLETSAGTATVKTDGALSKKSPPIAE
jgi:hypothetical protein